MFPLPKLQEESSLATIVNLHQISTLCNTLVLGLNPGYSVPTAGLVAAPSVQGVASITDCREKNTNPVQENVGHRSWTKNIVWV